MFFALIVNYVLALSDWHTFVPSFIILVLHIPSVIGFFCLCHKMTAHHNEDEPMAGEKERKHRPSIQTVLSFFEDDILP